MKTTTSLCFTKDGLANPEAFGYLRDKSVTTAVLFSDGSQEAFEHMRSFDLQPVRELVSHIAVGRVPMYDMRVVGADGAASKPHYVNSDDDRVKWICSRICTHLLTISISDMTSQSNTQSALDTKQVEIMCYLAHRLWEVMKLAEERLSFPAVVIDAMTRYTYSLTPETIDIAALQRNVGLKDLEYNHHTDLLSVTVSGDIFSVKLSVLNEVYGQLILPLFNSIFGRRLNLQVTVLGSGGKVSDPMAVTYGQLGSIVEDLRSYASERKITASNPLQDADLLLYAKKVRINELSCYWPDTNQSIAELLDAHHDELVRERRVGHTADLEYT